MSDVERLEQWFREGTLLRPGPPAPNTVDLIRALAHLSGAEGFAADQGAQALAQRIGPAEHVVFVLIDGLGANLVERLAPERFLRRQLAQELQSVFPSATASAITALATGDWPARHGVPGWWTHFPEHELTAVALPFLERFGGQPLGELGIEAAQVYPLPPLLARFTRRTHSFQPARIAQSAYSDYFRGPSPNGGYRDLEHGVSLVVDHVERSPEPSYTYLYVPTLDEAQHYHGPSSAEVQAHLLELDEVFDGLASSLGHEARLVISSDHGLVEVPGERKHILLPDDPLLALLAVPPSGEPRAPVFHVKPGKHAAFADSFRQRFGEAYALLTTDEVGALELLGPGPLSDVTRARVGDFLAVGPGPDVLLSRQGEQPSSTERMIGYHGGLLPDEVRIPLVIA